MNQIFEKVETGSTSDDAKDLARAGCGPFTIVWAHRQNKGRGQHNRAWRSYEGNVFWSIVLRPNQNWKRHSDIIYVMSLAVLNTLQETIPGIKGLSLKWPNDTMLNNRKLGGTLTEASGFYTKPLCDNHHPQPEWIVSGTGINIVPIDDDPTMVYPPTSLQQAGYTAASRDQIIKQLGDNTVKEVEFWERKGFGSVRDRYLTHAFGLNSHIRVGVNPMKTEYREGIYRGVNMSGALLLEQEDGNIAEYHSGEIIRTDENE